MRPLLSSGLTRRAHDDDLLVSRRGGSLTTAVLGASVAAPAHAEGGDDVRVACNTPALIAAITTANTAPDGAVLRLPNRRVYPLTAAPAGETGLPAITGNVGIVSRGAVIQRDTAAAALLRILEIAPAAGSRWRE
ncbi:hypothetical protein [Streptomyces antarcticus]|uniref:hypothetical protein n=1 Tax=Streptomyces antarcticus TaxID=2996458 RepID=UPI00226F0434|nr:MULTISPECIES: hypothetical protein [unclassified Streptomyces]MCY0947368.1 hypothetical protein [Streptomyces sp. H34-AA3]MCZ4086461.1 hypothetical protein [Streptomyces sp. H34-S5]